MSISNACCFPKSLFEANAKTVAAATGVALVTITLLALGVLGLLNTIPTLHVAAIPMTASGSVVLALDLAWIVSLCRANTKPIEPVKNPPKPSKTITLTVPERPLNRKDFGLLDPKDFGIREIDGRGFPLVDQDRKQRVIDETITNMYDILLPTQVKKLVNYFQYSSLPGERESKDFFPVGDVLQTPMKMEYDEHFEPKQGKNFFLMFSAAAPKPQNFKNETDYLDAMEMCYYHLLEQMVVVDEVFTCYWGMGAFIRDYIEEKYPDQKDAAEFRYRIAKRLANAFTRLCKNHRKITFNIGGPTGESFKKEFQIEPRDNYNAFVRAFGECESQYKDRIVFHRDTDIFVKAQEMSDQKKLNQFADGMTSIGVTNAASKHKIGNRWYIGRYQNKQGQPKFNAQFATDENVFRRSPLLAYIADMIYTLGKAQKETVRANESLCSLGLKALKKGKSAQPTISVSS